jgi:poly(3-hydroxybutyrate) depolymerase
VFQTFELPRGVFTWRGHPVDLRAIRTTALLTVEGGRDDICGPGQTEAALDLCPRVPLARKSSYREPGVGHYGVFSGRRWEQHIYPVLREFVAVNDRTPSGRRTPDAA